MQYKIANKELFLEEAKTTKDPAVMDSLIDIKDSDFFEEILYYLGQNPNRLTDKVVDTITDYPDVSVNLNLAYRSDLTVEQIKKLIYKTDSPLIRRIIASRTSKREVLDLLLKDEDPTVLRSVYSNSLLDIDTLRNLELDTIEKAEGVANNPNTTPDILNKIYDRFIGSTTSRTIEVERLLYDLIKNKNTSNRTIYNILSLRWGVSENIIYTIINQREDLTPEILHLILAKDKQGYYTEKILKKPNTPIKVLEEIINENSFPFILVLAAKSLKQPELLSLVLKKSSEFWYSTKFEVLESLIENDKTPIYLHKPIIDSLFSINSERPDFENLWDKAKEQGDLLVSKGNARPKLKDYYNSVLKRKEYEIYNYHKENSKKRFNQKFKVVDNITLKSKTNSDLELLKRLKGYIKDAPHT